MAQWRNHPEKRPLRSIPPEQRVTSACGRFVATFYLVSENDDEDSDGGMHEIMIYDAATERPIAKLARAWRVNYRTGYTSGSMTREISFDPEGETLLINGGQGGDDGEVNRVPFVAALTAISTHCAAAPDRAAAFLASEDRMAFRRIIKESISVPIGFSDLNDLIEIHLRSPDRQR